MFKVQSNKFANTKVLENIVNIGHTFYQLDFLQEPLNDKQHIFIASLPKGFDVYKKKFKLIILELGVVN
jgi:hypothetical protein